MEGKAGFAIMLMLLLIGASAFAFSIHEVVAYGTIYIRADGSVDPHTAPISSLDNVTYTITGNIYSFVVVQRDNIVVDGAHYLLYGDGALESKGIALAGRRNVTVTNCRIQRFGYGILLSGCLNCIILGNNISGLPNNAMGINIQGSNDNSILRNYIAQNGMAVAMGSSSNNTISENNIENNWDGLHLEHLSNNTFSRNNITGHESYGILFYYSTNNIVSENNITDNGQYGIALGLSSSYNSIYHNNFADNPIGVYAQDCMNVWDSGYPSGGNYWSYYTGIDLNHGSHQDATGSDGIIDTAYTIDGNNKDNYPLMSPYQYWGSPILGDINRDTKVNETDLFQLAAAYGFTPEEPNWNPNCDLYNDCQINAIDLFDLGKNYGKTYPL